MPRLAERTPPRLNCLPPLVHRSWYEIQANPAVISVSQSGRRHSNYDSPDYSPASVCERSKRIPEYQDDACIMRPNIRLCPALLSRSPRRACHLLEGVTRVRAIASQTTSSPDVGYPRSTPHAPPNPRYSRIQDRSASGVASNVVPAVHSVPLSTTFSCCSAPAPCAYPPYL